MDIDSPQQDDEFDELSVPYDEVHLVDSDGLTIAAVHAQYVEAESDEPDVESVLRSTHSAEWKQATNDEKTTQDD